MLLATRRVQTHSLCDFGSTIRHRACGSALSTRAIPRGSTCWRPTRSRHSAGRRSRSSATGARLGYRYPHTDPHPDSSLDLTTSISRTARTTFARASSTARGMSDRTTVEASGRRARRRVPARVDTRLVAGQLKLVRAKGSRGRKPRTRRVIVVRPTVDFGRTIPIRGRLATPGGNPVANASIEVWEQISTPGAASRRIAVIGTDGNGRFKFKALRGPSRIVPVQVRRQPTRSRANHRGRDQCQGDDDVQDQSQARGQWRRHRPQRTRPRPTAPARRQAGSAPGVFARPVDHVRHTARRRDDRAMELSLSVHVDARHGALSLPCPRATGGRLPVRVRDITTRPRRCPGTVTRCATLLIVGLW